MADATSVNKKTRQPRPPQQGFLVGTRFQPDLLQLIDDWRREQADPPTRPEAIRRLVVRALRSD
jgi:hypothetical protein